MEEFMDFIYPVLSKISTALMLTYYSKVVVGFLRSKKEDKHGS